MSKKFIFTDDNGNYYPDWEQNKLGNFLRIPNLKRVPTEQIDKNKLITVKLHMKGLFANTRTDSLQIGSTNYFRRSAGQLIYGKQNLFNGALGIIPEHLDGFLSSQDIPALDVDESQVDAGFLIQFLGREDFYRSLEKIATGTGSKRISEKIFLNINVSLPSLPEQERIAEFFGALDERIALTADKVKLLKEQKTGYLQQVFNRELVFTDDNGEQYPEWEQKKLEEVASVTSGKRLPKGHQFTSSGTPYITVSDMGDKRVDHKRFSFISPATETVLQRYKVTKGDVIISIAGTLGKVNLIDASLEQANLTENCDKIRVNERIMPEFIYYVLKSSSIQSDIEKTSTTSSQPKLALEQLRNFSIPTPSLSEQRKIAEFFSVLDERIELTENKLALLKEQKKGYLQGIFG